MRIEKKCWPDMFRAILEGRKRFDARIADFDCRPGDILVLREWDPGKGAFTGRVLEKSVGYAMRTKDALFWDQAALQKHGLLIMSLD